MQFFFLPPELARILPALLQNGPIDCKHDVKEVGFQVLEMLRLASIASFEIHARAFVET